MTTFPKEEFAWIFTCRQKAFELQRAIRDYRGLAAFFRTATAIFVFKAQLAQVSHIEVFVYKIIYLSGLLGCNHFLFRVFLFICLPGAWGSTFPSIFMRSLVKEKLSERKREFEHNQSSAKNLSLIIIILPFYRFYKEEVFRPFYDIPAYNLLSCTAKSWGQAIFYIKDSTGLITIILLRKNHGMSQFTSGKLFVVFTAKKAPYSSNF